MRRQYWLVTTDHLEVRIWFKDDEDFKAAMNFVAVLSTMAGLRIVAFVLMSNHVHFILECEYSVAEVFISRLKKMYSQYYSKKYGACGFLRRNSVDYQEVAIGDESFERAVAYVQMNSVAANICLHPSGYPWGTGPTFFALAPEKGAEVGSLSARARWRLLHSKLPIPDNYLVAAEGYILPSSYVPVTFVESVFRTPKRMNFFLQNSSKARKVKEAPAFSDQLIAGALRDLTVSLFHKNGINELSDAQLAELIRQIRFRFSSYPAQIGRVCGLPYEKVCELLEVL